MSILSVTAAAVAALVVSSTAGAQAPAPAERPPAAPAVSGAAGAASGARPRVCLVLSGGGARGAAHIGVLKVLEEYRVPVDCIAGTSMGALVGAGYASGMSVAEMEQLTQRLTIDALFREQPPRQERTVRRKQDDALNLFAPQIGLRDDGSVLLAKGAISGIRLETVLREISRIKGPVDFDRLPIPFRAVATDLVTGKPKVFDHGELASAMRASMSVPGIIAPAEVDGMMLVDGGLVNNLPVDVARAMGADVVIAVNLGTPLMRREQIQDVLGITGQMIGILTEQNVQRTLESLEPSDILILPELGDYSAGDFDHMATTWPIGEAAARKVADRLAALSLPPQRYAELRERQRAVPPPDTRPVDEITFSPMARVNPEYLRSLLDAKPGEPLDTAQLDRNLARLYGTDDFERISYQILESPARRILNIDAVEKSWGPNYLRFGLGLTSDFDGGAYFSVLGQYRRTWMDSRGAEWRTDISLGRATSLVTEYYQPLDERQNWFVAPRLEFERTFVDIFADDLRIAEYSLPSALAGLDVGTSFARYGEIRAGFFGGVAKPSINNGIALIDDERSATLAGVRLRGFVDQLDNVNFPRSGYAFGVELSRGLKALGSDLEYDRWDASGTVAYATGPHALVASMRGSGPITQDAGGLYIASPWGGFLQQSGFATGQLLNRDFAYGRLVYTNRIFAMPLFDGVYAGAAAEAGYYGTPAVTGNPRGMLYSGAVFLAVDSPLGPVYLGYGAGSGGNRSAYFFLGRP